MKKLLLLFVLFSSQVMGQTTLIPDSAFEQALINLGYDTGIPDGSVPTANIDTATFLDVGGFDISDLTGIADFTALSELYCSSNQLTSLDVSYNTALTALACSSNQLTSLDVSNNTALYELYCSYNQLTSLDVSNNTALYGFQCNANQLTSLDVSNNTTLTSLNCSTNQLTSLDVSNITTLLWLHCNFNQLTSFDVSNNTALLLLECNSSQLTSLDVSNNTALTELNCGYNNFTSLDVSNNTALTDLWCNVNELTCLNVKNGNNVVLTSFNATGNPDLICMEVDDAAWSTTNWTNVDAQTSFSNDCNYPIPCGSGTTSIPEHPIRDNQLIKITDILGRAILPVPNQILFYKYSDGSVEKRMILE